MAVSCTLGASAKAATWIESDAPYLKAPLRSNEEKIQFIFRAFDKDEDGKLNKHELRELLITISPNLRGQLDKLFQEAEEHFAGTFGYLPAMSLEMLCDAYKDGKADLRKDFVSVWKRYRPEEAVPLDPEALVTQGSEPEEVQVAELEEIAADSDTNQDMLGPGEDLPPVGKVSDAQGASSRLGGLPRKLIEATGRVFSPRFQATIKACRNSFVGSLFTTAMLMPYPVDLSDDESSCSSELGQEVVEVDAIKVAASDDGLQKGETGQDMTAVATSDPVVGALEGQQPAGVGEHVDPGQADSKLTLVEEVHQVQLASSRQDMSQGLETILRLAELTQRVSPNRSVKLSYVERKESPQVTRDLCIELKPDGTLVQKSLVLGDIKSTPTVTVPPCALQAPEAPTCKVPESTEPVPSVNKELIMQASSGTDVNSNVEESEVSDKVLEVFHVAEDKDVAEESHPGATSASNLTGSALSEATEYMSAIGSVCSGASVYGTVVSMQTPSSGPAPAQGPSGSSLKELPLSSLRPSFSACSNSTLTSGPSVFAGITRPQDVFSPEEKVNIIFQCFDQDSDGALNEMELRCFLRCVKPIGKKDSRSARLLAFLGDGYLEAVQAKEKLAVDQETFRRLYQESKKDVEADFLIVAGRYAERITRFSAVACLKRATSAPLKQTGKQAGTSQGSSRVSCRSPLSRHSEDSTIYKMNPVNLHPVSRVDISGEGSQEVSGPAQTADLAGKPAESVEGDGAPVVPPPAVCSSGRGISQSIQEPPQLVNESGQHFQQVNVIVNPDAVEVTQEVSQEVKVVLEECDLPVPEVDLVDPALKVPRLTELEARVYELNCKVDELTKLADVDATVNERRISWAGSAAQGKRHAQSRDLTVVKLEVVGEESFDLKGSLSAVDEEKQTKEVVKEASKKPVEKAKSAEKAKPAEKFSCLPGINQRRRRSQPRDGTDKGKLKEREGRPANPEKVKRAAPQDEQPKPMVPRKSISDVQGSHGGEGPAPLPSPPTAKNESPSAKSAQKTPRVSEPVSATQKLRPQLMSRSGPKASGPMDSLTSTTAMAGSPLSASPRSSAAPPSASRFHLGSYPKPKPRR